MPFSGDCRRDNNNGYNREGGDIDAAVVSFTQARSDLEGKDQAMFECKRQISKLNSELGEARAISG